jgi:radical SAM superfamily enzyme YgiQ (UPF0313 family)
MCCAFCSEKTVTGKFNKITNPIRKREVGNLCDEIEMVVNEYNLNYIKFVDATFDVSPEFVINFCKEKINRKITVPWEAMLHASFVNEEMIYWMKESNCNQTNIGCESGSEKILQSMNKGVKISRIKEVFALLKKYKIKSRAFFLLGMPTENKDDIDLTEKLVDEIKPDYVGFTMLCPYPGCDLYDYEKMKDIDWSKTDEYSNDFWRNKNFTNKELKETQLYFKTKYDDIMCERQKNG